MNLTVLAISTLPSNIFSLNMPNYLRDSPHDARVAFSQEEANSKRASWLRAGACWQQLKKGVKEVILII